MEEQQETAGKRVPVSSEKLKALQAAMDKIEKSYGRGAIMKLGDDSVEEVAVIPTGSIALNAALGVGGYPRGRVIEIYGPESSGKTTLAIHAIAEAQKAGGIAAIIDAEHAFDRCGESVDFAARQWRAGVGDCRPVDSFIGCRYSRYRLGCRFNS